VAGGGRRVAGGGRQGKGGCADGGSDAVQTLLTNTMAAARHAGSKSTCAPLQKNLALASLPSLVALGAPVWGVACQFNRWAMHSARRCSAAASFDAATQLPHRAPASSRVLWLAASATSRPAPPHAMQAAHAARRGARLGGGGAEVGWLVARDTGVRVPAVHIVDGALG
jgi:hypothetical protein